MKNFSIEELRGMLSEIKNSERKRDLYFIIGILIVITTAAVAVAAFFIKKHMDEKEADDMYDDWDDCDDCDDDYCNCADKDEAEPEENDSEEDK